MLVEVTQLGKALEKDSKGKFFQVDGSIEATNFEKGFTYLGCKKCKKKLNGTSCETCKAEMESIPYYMFSIMITDGTDSIWVSVFGEVGDTLLGKPANELIDLKESDNDQFKQIWGKLRNKVFI